VPSSRYRLWAQRDTVVVMWRFSPRRAATVALPRCGRRVHLRAQFRSPRVVGQIVTEVGFAPVVELPEWTPCRVVGVVDRVGVGGQDLAERKGKIIHEWRVFDEIAVMAHIAKARGEGPTTR